VNAPDSGGGGSGKMRYRMKRAVWGVLTPVGIDRRRNRHRWVYPERRRGWRQRDRYATLVSR
jgi:hypothetical protein